MLPYLENSRLKTKGLEKLKVICFPLCPQEKIVPLRGRTVLALLDTSQVLRKGNLKHISFIVYTFSVISLVCSKHAVHFQETLDITLLS